MFRPYRVIIRLTFRRHWKKFTYCIVQVRSHFLCILLLMCSKSQLDDDPLRSKHTAVWILYKVVFHYSNIYPTRCNITQFILSGNCSTCFGWYLPPIIRSANNCIYNIWYMVWQIAEAVDTVVCAPDDVWRYHPKHVEQFPDKINCVTLHLVGYILEEYSYNARTHEH